MSEITDELLDIVAAEGLVERRMLTPDAQLEDLGIASVDIVTIVFTLEERFGVQLDLERLREAITVGQLVELVTLSIAEKSQRQTASSA